MLRARLTQGFSEALIKEQKESRSMSLLRSRLSKVLCRAGPGVKVPGELMFLPEETGVTVPRLCTGLVMLLRYLVFLCETLLD